MEILQIRLNKMAVFCYLIGDESSRTGALIDPAFETDRILAVVKEKGYRITHVINTHCHSDHTAGNAAIIAATGAKLLIHERDAENLIKMLNRSFTRILGGKASPRPDILLKDNDVITIGSTVLNVIHTPGHTPGGICLLAGNNIFTGDTLFVGAVGRTDLPGGSYRQLSRAIREKIYTLPEETIVWPGHDYGISRVSSVAREKKDNPQ
jgi:glyoxylase-like metal-dependent hydrolase (beta-lactamase superfamily II)